MMSANGLESEIRGVTCWLLGAEALLQQALLHRDAALVRLGARRVPRSGGGGSSGSRRFSLGSRRSTYSSYSYYCYYYYYCVPCRRGEARALLLSHGG